MTREEHDLPSVDEMLLKVTRYHNRPSARFARAVAGSTSETRETVAAATVMGAVVAYALASGDLGWAEAAGAAAGLSGVVQQWLRSTRANRISASDVDRDSKMPR